MPKYDASHFPKILVIDTANREQTTVGVIIKGQETHLSQPVRAQELQLLIQELLNEEQQDLSDLRAIAVLNPDSGSQTGIRIGVTTANTLGWLLNIPIINLPYTDYSQAIEAVQSGSEFEVVKSAVPAS